MMLTPKKLWLKWLGPLACTLVMTACTDKAKPEFERCQQLQTYRKFNEAREACQRAVAADPESKAGKLAAARIPVIDTEAVKSAQAERAERDRSSAAIDEAEAKSRELKTRFDAAIARVTQLQGELSRTMDPDAKARVEGELAKVQEEKAAIATEIRGGKSPSGKPCNCPPGDPLCSCL